MTEEDKILQEVTTSEYKYGFVTDIDSDTIKKGLSEDVIRLISMKKNEPDWLLEWRLDAFRKFQKMTDPEWANVTYDKPDLQSISYYSAPKPKKTLESLDEVDPELLKTFEKLGISLEEQKRLTGVAVDIVVDSVSVATSEFFRGFGVPTSPPMDRSNQVRPLSCETMTVGVATRGVT